MTMITIDGSYGEGGGQILRTSLALSLVTGKPFTIHNIRAGRKKPGLMRQHLTALNAATQIGNASVSGNTTGAQSFTFEPETITPGSYHFAIGSAGSCTLVLQTVLPALMIANGSSDIILEGGTHNPFAPPFDFLQKAFLPVIQKFGPTVTAELKRPGFYPAGGGIFQVSVSPAVTLKTLDLSNRGPIVSRTSNATVANLPVNIAARELKTIGKMLSWPETCLNAVELNTSCGPGNIVTIEVESEAVTEVFTGFGERGVSAERVAKTCAKQAREYLSTDVSAGRYLADQLLVPMAMAGGGKFTTLSPSRHTTTNIDIIKRFLDVDIIIKEIDTNMYEIEIVS